MVHRCRSSFARPAPSCELATARAPLAAAGSSSGRRRWLLGRWRLGIWLVAASLATSLPGEAAGILSLVDQERNNVGGVSELDGPEIAAFSPDGRHLYVAGTLADEILVFAFDQETGELTFVDDTHIFAPAIPSELAGLAVSPDGKFVYASLRKASRIRWYSRNPDTGRLTQLGSITENDPAKEFLTGAGEIVISRDGLDLYVVAADDAAVSHLERDPVDGALEYVRGLKFTIGGVDFTKGARGLAMSPDGRNLYLACATTGSVVMFTLAEDGGLRTPSQRILDQTAGANLVAGANAVNVSPDGRYVYATAGDDGARLGLVRGQNGHLMLLEQTAVGAGAHGLVVNPAGDRLFLGTGNGVRAYARDVEFGNIGDELGSLLDGVGGINFLAGGRRPLLSPNGRFLVVVAPTEDAVSSIAIDEEPGLYLVERRFRVTASFTTNQGVSGALRPVNLSDDTGYGTFFSPSNVELLVKVLDGCAVNQRWWVFVGGLTNVAVELTVEDTQTGAQRTYANPQGTAFVPQQDTQAFVCP
jgi:6-phosphogluconolactonase (cycloisomerase 2 family)